MFNSIKCDTAVVSLDSIESLDTTELIDLVVYVVTKSGARHIATNLNAIDIVMAIHPSALEGLNLKWPMFVWFIHNMVGHPVMQLLALLGYPKLGLWVHNVTVPRPKGKRQGH